MKQYKFKTMEQILSKYVVKEIKDIDEKQGIVSAYANAFNILDEDGDVSLPGSFTKTLQENLGRMRWLLNHDTDKLLGVPFIDGGIQDSFGLLGNNKFNMQKEIARDTFEDYKLYKEFGRTLEHSVRVRAKKSEILEGDAIPIEFRKDATDKQFNQIRLVKEWMMLEMSTVMWGANEKTPLVDIKSLSEMDETLRFLEKMLKGNYTDERLKKIEETYNILQSLKNEPLKTTPKEPEKNTNIEPLVNAIKQSKLFN